MTSAARVVELARVPDLDDLESQAQVTRCRQQPWNLGAVDRIVRVDDSCDASESGNCELEKIQPLADQSVVAPNPHSSDVATRPSQCCSQAQKQLGLQS